MHPVEADGCGLVILRERRGFFRVSYDVVESGVMVYDGETMRLEHSDGSTREVPEGEWSDMLNVTPANRIPQCAGFQFFILRRNA